MNEDWDRTRLGHGAENLAALRHMALNAVQKEGSKGSLRGKFKRAGWDDDFLTRLLAMFRYAIALALSRGHASCFASGEACWGVGVNGYFA